MLGVVGTCCVVHASQRNYCQHCWLSSKEAMHSDTVIIKKDCSARAQTFSRGQLNIVVVPCKRAQHCCATLRRSQNNINVGTCCAKFDRLQTIRNKCQHGCGSMQTDATCWAQRCCVLLANNVASVCMGLYNIKFSTSAKTRDSLNYNLWCVYCSDIRTILGI